MQIILLEKVINLGNLGELINVKPGYARNFLIPQGKAVPATQENLKYFEHRRTELEIALQETQNAAKLKVMQINKLNNITIAAKAGKTGKLFGSIGIRNIIEAIANKGININKNEVKLVNGVIRSTGQHTIKIKIHHSNIVIDLIVLVTAK